MDGQNWEPVTIAKSGPRGGAGGGGGGGASRGAAGGGGVIPRMDGTAAHMRKLGELLVTRLRRY